jgi:hypothetical protein
MALPENDDVVIRQTGGNPCASYLLGTPVAPSQFTVKTRDRAVRLAVAYAKRQRARAWFAESDGHFVLLGTFREKRESSRSPDGNIKENSEVGAVNHPLPTARTPST